MGHRSLNHRPSPENNMRIDIISLLPGDCHEEAFTTSVQGGANRVEIRQQPTVRDRVAELRARGDTVRVFTLETFRQMLSPKGGITHVAEKQLALQAAQMGFT